MSAQSARMTGRMYVDRPGPAQMSLSRTCAARPATVFDAFTTPETLLGWFYSDRDLLTSCTAEFQAGGQTRYVWTGRRDGDETRLVFDWKSIERPHRLRYWQTFPDWPEGRADVETRFELQGALTLVTIMMTFANDAIRDAVFATTVPDHIEEAFARLDGLLAAGLESEA